MTKIEFKAIVKDFNSRALVSLDKGYQIKLITSDKRVKGLIEAPADKEITCQISWE